jgi:hypothetical protein
MQGQIQIEEIEPSYNGYVVPESIELATALDQYWLERRALCEQTIERYSVAAADTAAERDWQSFCSHGTSFLKKYLTRATDSIDSPFAISGSAALRWRAKPDGCSKRRRRRKSGYPSRCIRSDLHASWLQLAGMRSATLQMLTTQRVSNWDERTLSFVGRRPTYF